MSVILLDFGSGETCKNDKAEVRRMIDGLAAVDSHRHQVYVKWQLFTKVPAPVPPLDHEVYVYAVQYAAERDYMTSASVFDEYQLDFLLGLRAGGVPLPFVKLAARPRWYRLLEKIPRDVPVYLSLPNAAWRDCLTEMYPRAEPVRWLYCVPEYPASSTKYETLFGNNLCHGISDHTTDFRLFKEYEPMFFEKHFKLPDSTGLDSGDFAATPGQLREIL